MNKYYFKSFVTLIFTAIFDYLVEDSFLAILLNYGFVVLLMILVANILRLHMSYRIFTDMETNYLSRRVNDLSARLAFYENDLDDLK